MKGSGGCVVQVVVLDGDVEGLSAQSAGQGEASAVDEVEAVEDVDE